MKNWNYVEIKWVGFFGKTFTRKFGSLNEEAIKEEIKRFTKGLELKNFKIISINEVKGTLTPSNQGGN